MEKKIKFEDVIAFINKAIDTNCKISVYFYKELSHNILYISKEISKDEIKTKTVSWYEHDSKLYINLTSNGITENYGDYIIEVTNQKDILKWKILIENVIEYSHHKLEVEFDNFFNIDSKPTTINDLDNEDD